MKRSPVVSSMMAAVAYDSRKQILEIEFLSGDVYQYLAVPEDIARALLAASSKGRFFHAQIDGIFRYRRITHARTTR